MLVIVLPKAALRGAASRHEDSRARIMTARLSSSILDLSCFSNITYNPKPCYVLSFVRVVFHH